MSKNDRDWTFVNRDGLVEAAKSRESDSDQDFEVLAKPDNGEKADFDFVQFKGIFIKEDHFSDGVKDDESDIEVLKKDPMAIESLTTSSDTDDRESIEILESGPDTQSLKQNDHWSLIESGLLDATNGTDSDQEKVQQLEDTLTSDSDIGIEDIANLFIEDEANGDADCSDGESENEYDGLHLLFGEKAQQCNITTKNSGAKRKPDLENLLRKLEKVSNKCNQRDYRNDSRITDDGIVLSTSMFIILLCLSVSTGLIIGKGLMCISRMYNLERTVTIDGPTSEAPIHPRNKKPSPDNATKSHNMLVKQMLEKGDTKIGSVDVRPAYQELQLQYFKLQKKYSYLHQQHQIQKQILLFTKKLRNMNDIKMNPSPDKGSNENRTNAQRELLWWKMRTAVWRKKYLDLKVQFLETKNFPSGKRPNITFKSCTGLLTEYLPGLNITALLKSETSSRIASSAKMCWKRVFSPVRAVSDRMGKSLSGFCRGMDGFWEKFRKKWNKKSNTGGQDTDDAKVKVSSKWQRFRKMFSMSSIIGSLKQKEMQKRKQNPTQEQNVAAKKYCDVMSQSKKLMDGEQKEEDVSYMKPQPNTWNANEPQLNDESSPQEFDRTEEMNVEFLGPSVISIKKRGFKECKTESTSKDLSSKLEEKEAKLKVRYENFASKARQQSNKIRNKEKQLKQKLDAFEEYENKKREDIELKREILEKKMRKHSNRKRNVERTLKKKERKLENMIKKMEKKFEDVFVKKAKELNMKMKAQEKKFKNLIQENLKEKKKLNEEKVKFNRRVNKLKTKLKRNEEELAQKRKEFEAWSTQVKQKILEESLTRRKKGERKLKQKESAMLQKMEDKIRRKEEKFERKSSMINTKVDQLRSALRRLVHEEQARAEEILTKNEELRIKQSQVDMVKLFYADVLKQEKEKHAKAKEMVWQMKQRIINLKEVHKEFVDKYKDAQEKLAKKRKDLKDEESVTVNHKTTVYCPDQQSCQGLKINGYAATKVFHEKGTAVPLVFCPGKDNCQGRDSMAQQFEEFENYYKDKNWKWDTTQAEAKVLKRTTALRPVPPRAHDVTNVNPFFIRLNIQKNTTSSDGSETKSEKQEETKKGAHPDSRWYFNLMHERAKQRTTPWSWYLYWSQGRTGWRNAVGKKESDNWYLKAMQERERQRNTPVHWFFKHGKEKEEDSMHLKSSWFLNRGRGREDARKNEGYYYCW